MKFIQLKKHLQNDTLFPAYLITGEDAFVRTAALKHFEKLVTDFPDMNISVFYGTQDAIGIIAACQTLPMVSKKRLVICHDFKGDSTAFENYLKNPSLETVLVFVSEKLPENLKKIIPSLQLVDCAKLDDDTLTRWITGKLNETNTQIERDAMHLLISYCSRDLMRISRESEKLGAFRLNAVVTASDVKDLVGADEEYKIYELSEAVITKNSQKTADIMTNMLENKMPVVNLLGALYSHFRRLLFCTLNSQDNELYKKLGVKEYAVTMAQKQAKAFSPKKLKYICDEFHALDYAIKSGGMGDKMGLTSYVLKVLNV